MRSKSSSRRSGRGCAGTRGPYGLRLVLLLLAVGAPGLAAQTAVAPPKPLLVLLDAETQAWDQACAERGWRCIAPWVSLPGADVDQRIHALEAKLGEVEKSGTVDPRRVYLAGHGESASAVFYVAARAPYLWAAAVALGGTPRPAIDSNRLYAANTTDVPVLWLFAPAEDEQMARELQSAGFNLEWRRETTVQLPQVMDWMAGHQQDEFPAKVDCETGNQSFPRCYWIEITRFDAAQRNDVLDSTRVQPGSGAFLAVGPFGFDANAPGPGVLVSLLPPKYEGPLRVNDRIVAIDGKPLPDAHAYVQLMDQTVQEKPAVIMVQRGDQRQRIETKITLPKRVEMITARVQGQYLTESKEIQVISRAVAQMRLNVPPQWVPATITWNGSELVKAESAGCWLLNEKEQLLHAGRCP